MKKLIVLLAASCSMMFAENDATGSYRLTGLHVVYYDIARADVTVTVHDAYGMGVVVPVQEIPSGAIFNSTPNGPHGEPYLNAVGVNLNVTLNEDGSGQVTEGSYYPDINQVDCVSQVQVLPITDDLGYSADNSIGAVVPATNVLGLPSNSPRVGQTLGGLGLFQSEILDFFPMYEQPEKIPAVLPFVATTDGTLLAVSCGLACVTPQEALGGATLTDAVFGGDAGACTAACDAADPATAAAQFGGAGWMQGSVYGMYGTGDLGASMSAGNVDPQFYLEWSALDGPTSQSGLGDIIGEDEDGDGTDYDRIFGIPYTTVTTMNPACGFNLPIAGDVSALFPAECVEGVTSGNDFYLMDASLTAWGGFLTYNAASYQQVQGMCAQMGIDAATCDGYIAGNVPLADYDGDGVTEITELAGSETILSDGWWSYYNWDMRVDSEGDVHILMTYVPGGAEYLYFLDNASGYYHITIDKDHIDAPGDINTPEGWNWSLVMPGGSDAWSVDADNDTYAEIWDSHANLSFSKDDPDVVWAVFNVPTTGAYISETVEENATSCGQWDTFIPSPADLDNWSFDIYVAKSIDGGMTWSDAENVSNTPGDFSNGAYDGPEEMYPHTPAFSTDDSVTIMYQVPNWAWNEIGDPTGADHMNYVYVANASVESLSTSDNDSTDDGVVVPNNFELTQNYPNPFNPSTTIDFSVPNLSDINISVYDINGRLVKTLMNNTLTSGTYSVVWNGDDMNGNAVSAGIYMYSLTSDEISITNKMILVK